MVHMSGKQHKGEVKGAVTGIEDKGELCQVLNKMGKQS